jgi:hypothetical protein
MEVSTTLSVTSPPMINQVALIMSIFGWQGHKHERLGDQTGSVSCGACFRVLGLWLFKSKDVNESGEEVVGAAISCLDVIEQHRDYCPWRSVESQSGSKATNKSTDTLAGWAVVLRVLKNDYHLRTNGQRQSKKLTPSRTTTQLTDTPTLGVGIEDDEDAEGIREENDNKRWARLKRVKSLFETKKKDKTPKKL